MDAMVKNSYERACYKHSSQSKVSKMSFNIVILVLINLSLSSSIIIDIDFEKVFNHHKKLPRFWTNTGLCPPAPIENATQYLLSKDNLLNLEIIGSLPNQGLKHVRIHWMLDMIHLDQYEAHQEVVYNFTNLDMLMTKLDEFHLYPGFEIMGNPSNIFSENKDRFEYLWEDLVYQIASRYIGRFGIDKVSVWKFETWNEPDLKNYNILNMTTSEYISYAISVSRGLKAASHMADGVTLSLKGPAGLFKSIDKHPFCWTILKYCNENLKKCPFDGLTFHRKGNGVRAEEILNGALNLTGEILSRFPNLNKMKYSNDEADPVSGWSTPRNFQSNMKYAVILLTTIFQHWGAIFDGELRNLDSISHDNAFLSYYPHEFDQRTLLARFQMNLTEPPHVQFISKPVYSLLGMLGNSAMHASDYVKTKNNVSYLTTFNESPFFSCVIITQSNDTFDLIDKRTHLSIGITLVRNGDQNLMYFVESLQAGLTDPVSLWNFFGNPYYPNKKERKQMRSVQSPIVLKAPTLLGKNETRINFNLTLRTPWIVSLRICSSSLAPPTKVKNLRLRKIFKNEVMLFWSEAYTSARCTTTYEIFFKVSGHRWVHINKNTHTPFLYFQFSPAKSRSVEGRYKVRAVDVFGRRGQFSKAHSFK